MKYFLMFYFFICANIFMYGQDVHHCLTCSNITGAHTIVIDCIVSLNDHNHHIETIEQLWIAKFYTLKEKLDTFNTISLYATKERSEDMSLHAHLELHNINASELQWRYICRILKNIIHAIHTDLITLHIPFDFDIHNN